MTVLEGFDKYGGNAIEEALEKGSLKMMS